MHTSDQVPSEPKQVGTGPAPPWLGKGMGLTEAIMVQGARLQSTRGVVGGAGSWSLGQGGPIDTRVVEGTVVLIAAVALHHEVSANRAV